MHREARKHDIVFVEKFKREAVNTDISALGDKRVNDKEFE